MASPSILVPFMFPLPSTRRSKSFSPTFSLRFEVIKSLIEPTFMSSLDLDTSLAEPELDRSCNFLICSCSILVESFLIRAMNSWNCCRFSSGPRLKLQRIGSASIAKNSVSAILPTCLKTARAAIMTAGSFVFMAFKRGTTFSCTVYLSSTALLLAFDFLGSAVAPSRSSLVPAPSREDPPQRITKASSPRTLMPRLLVLLNTVATIGKTSFLIVEKSIVASTVERHPKDLSTIA